MRQATIDEREQANFDAFCSLIKRHTVEERKLYQYTRFLCSAPAYEGVMWEEFADERAMILEVMGELPN